jgi:hypothetical protein
MGADIMALLSQFGLGGMGGAEEEKKPSTFMKVMNGLAMLDENYAKDARQSKRDDKKAKNDLRSLIIGDSLVGNREEAGDTRRFGHDDKSQAARFGHEDTTLDKTQGFSREEQQRQLDAYERMQQDRLDAASAENKKASKRAGKQQLRSIQATTDAMSTRDMNEFINKLQKLNAIDPENAVKAVQASEVDAPIAEAEGRKALGNAKSRFPLAFSPSGDSLIRAGKDLVTGADMPQKGRSGAAFNLKDLLAGTNTVPTSGASTSKLRSTLPADMNPGEGWNGRAETTPATAAEAVIQKLRSVGGDANGNIYDPTRRTRYNILGQIIND